MLRLTRSISSKTHACLAHLMPYGLTFITTDQVFRKELGLYFLDANWHLPWHIDTVVTTNGDHKQKGLKRPIESQVKGIFFAFL
jgi:hypothetical protein